MSKAENRNGYINTWNPEIHSRSSYPPIDPFIRIPSVSEAAYQLRVFREALAWKEQDEGLIKSEGQKADSGAYNKTGFKEESHDSIKKENE